MSINVDVQQGLRIEDKTGSDSIGSQNAIGMWLAAPILLLIRLKRLELPQNLERLGPWEVAQPEVSETWFDPADTFITFPRAGSVLYQEMWPASLAPTQWQI